jgi:hypothetical protein
MTSKCTVTGYGIWGIDQPLFVCVGDILLDLFDRRMQFLKMLIVYTYLTTRMQVGRKLIGPTTGISAFFC